MHLIIINIIARQHWIFRIWTFYHDQKFCTLVCMCVCVYASVCSPSFNALWSNRYEKNKKFLIQTTNRVRLFRTLTDSFSSTQQGAMFIQTAVQLEIFLEKTKYSFPIVIVHFNRNHLSLQVMLIICSERRKFKAIDQAPSRDINPDDRCHHQLTMTKSFYRTKTKRSLQSTWNYFFKVHFSFYFDFYLTCSNYLSTFWSRSGLLSNRPISSSKLIGSLTSIKPTNSNKE